jgi:hypothetical protein
MSANRGDSRRLEKQKRKRAEIKKKQTAAQAALRPSALLKRATDFPIDEAWLSTHWRDVDEQMPGLITAIVTRRSPGGVLVGTALVDRTCLGVKDGYYQVLTSMEADHYLAEVREHVELERVDTDTCMSVVHHAIDYARGLGFAPHEDFPAILFSPRPETLIETPLAHPSRPLYVAGPNDDTAVIFATLRAAAGSDFRYLIPTPDGEGYPVEARDTMHVLQSMGSLRTGEVLLRDGKIDEAEAICDELLKDGAVKFDAMELKAHVCEARGDLSAAIDWLRQALDARLDDVEPEEADSMRNELRRLMTETSRSDSSIDLLDDALTHADEEDRK